MNLGRRRPKRPVEAVLDDDALPVANGGDTEDIEVLRTAIELASARSAASSPSERFVTDLGRRLGVESGGPQVDPQRATRLLSRRTLIAATVAAGVAGGVAERLLTSAHDIPAHRPTAGSLSPVDGTWTAVTLNPDSLSSTPGRFVTAEVAGFVSEQANGLVAVSGVCTHLGCLLRANVEASRLDCPCHRTAFSYDGEVIFSQLPTPPAPLPRLRVRRRDGSVEVLLPPST